MIWRTRYQRTEAAARLARLLSERAKTPEVREIGASILYLLAAPAAMREAAEPDALRLMEKYGLLSEAEKKDRSFTQTLLPR